MDTEEKMRLSHSQVGSLSCNLSWWISRRARMPGLSYWSTIAGSVFHERIEYWLLNDRTWPTEAIADHVQRLVDKQLKNGPYTEDDGIRVSKALPSGLKPGEHPHGFNKAAVIAVIPLWQTKAVRWLADREAEGWHVWEYPDPEHGGATLKGVEVEVNYELGGHPVIGSIDLVLENHNTGEVWLVDWKAGRSKPDDTSQLDGYRIGFEEVFGIKPDLASFFMVRTGKEHLTASLPTFTRSMLDVKFREAGIRAVDAENGRFNPDPTRCAYLCSVKDFCPTVNGPMAELVLPLPTMREGA